jgi:excisionase family DNA binding protein
MTETDLLTVEQAAALLALKVSTIRAWILRRRIPFVKLGRRAVRLRRGDLHAMIDVGAVPAKPDRE